MSVVTAVLKPARVARVLVAATGRARCRVIVATLVGVVGVVGGSVGSSADPLAPVEYAPVWWTPDYAAFLAAMD